MKDELQISLYKKYPSLFLNKDKSIMESCMSWGIECGDGWYDILDSLCNSIDQHEKYMDDSFEQENYHKVRFDQVKEKFGGLRVYFSGGDEYVQGLISMAETMSYKICETCGHRGYPNEKGWISTLCDRCRKNN